GVLTEAPDPTSEAAPPRITGGPGSGDRVESPLPPPPPPPALPKLFPPLIISQGGLGTATVIRARSSSRQSDKAGWNSRWRLIRGTQGQPPGHGPRCLRGRVRRALEDLRGGGDGRTTPSTDKAPRLVSLYSTLRFKGLFARVVSRRRRRGRRP